MVLGHLICHRLVPLCIFQGSLSGLETLTRLLQALAQAQIFQLLVPDLFLISFYPLPVRLVLRVLRFGQHEAMNRAGTCRILTCVSEGEEEASFLRFVKNEATFGKEPNQEAPFMVVG